jgi:crossover junction endodeoxyribonuclease RuvC
LNTWFLGIDPGLTGALTFIDVESGEVDVHDMPTYCIEKPLTAAQKKRQQERSAAKALTETPEQTLARVKKQKNTSERNFVSPTGLANIMREKTDKASMQSVVRAYLESVASRPKDAALVAFSLGRSLGNIEQLVADFDIAAEFHRPSDWKKKMGLTDDKDLSLQMATRLAPACAHLWKRKMDDGRAESFLLCYFGLREMGVFAARPGLIFKPYAKCGVLQAA